MASGTVRDIINPVEFEIPSLKGNTKEVIDDIMDCTSMANLDVQFIRLALEEALTNAIEHGNKFDGSKTVSVRVETTEIDLRVRVRDQGGGFDYNSVPDPTSGDAVWKKRGRGIFLMRNIMDKVTFSRNGSEITLVKNF